MTAPRQDAEQDLEQLLASRNADLAELLSHVNGSWDEQRRQLARKLHDTLGSSLTALTMHLSLLARHLPADPAVQERSATMKQLLANIISANRAMQQGLWNDKLEFLGIKAALAELASDFSADTGIAVQVSLPEDDGACPQAHSVALLRCAEEGLRNIAAHARASAVSLVLDDDGEQLMLTIKDNGVGPGTPDPRRHGLRLLRERAASLGGSCGVAAGQDGGTTLTMVLPR